MLDRMVGCFAAAFVALLVAGCTAETTATGPALDTAVRPQTSAGFAFEPVTGIPEGRTAVLAEALVSDALERGIPIMPRQADDAAFRLKGYFSAARAGDETQISFAWDIFDRNDVRVHRIAGTETAQARLPDPWQAVTDDALRRIARRTMDGLENWLSEGAPISAHSPEPSEAEESEISGITALVAEPAESFIPAAARASTGPRVYIGTVAGAVGDGASSLARSLANRLAVAGISWVPQSAEADYVVSGEATVGPVQDTTQTVAIIWTVARPDGENLGTVRQVKHVDAGALDSGWGASADAAAGAAAPGILRLMHAQ